MPAATGQALSCSRSSCWFMWPITQSITTPQTLLLNHYPKVSHGNHPVPGLPSEGEFLPWKKQVLTLQHLHLLSQVMQDPTPDASRPSRMLETAFHWLCGKGVDDSRSLFPSFVLVLPSSLTTLQKAKHKFGLDRAGSDWALLHVQCQAERWLALGRLRWPAGNTPSSVTRSLGSELEQWPRAKTFTNQTR